jgi:hypothetical protein
MKNTANSKRIGLPLPANPQYTLMDPGHVKFADRAAKRIILRVCRERTLAMMMPDLERTGLIRIYCHNRPLFPDGMLDDFQILRAIAK